MQRTKTKDFQHQSLDPGQTFFVDAVRITPSLSIQIAGEGRVERDPPTNLGFSVGFT
jgi:hypothetical protein